MRILLVALELADALFSGNGVYGRAVARNLQQCGVDTDVLSASPNAEGAPLEWDFTDSFDTPQGIRPAGDEGSSGCARLTATAVPVPQQKWRRLDRGSAWQEFASGVVDVLVLLSSRARQEDRSLSSYDAILAVDWTGAHAVARAMESLAAADTPVTSPVVFLNFRVFVQSAADLSTTAKLVGPSPRLRAADDSDGAHVAAAAAALLRPGARPAAAFRLEETCSREELADADFFAVMEAAACQLATKTVALCRSDAASLRRNTASVLAQTADSATVPLDIGVVLPPLREDLATLIRHEGIGVHQPSSSSEAEDALWTFLLSTSTTDVKGKDRVLHARKASAGRAVRLVTCLVRLDPAKEALRFVSIVEKWLARQQQPEEVHVQGKGGTYFLPFIAGVAGDPEYAAKVVRRLDEVCGTHGVVIADRFLDAKDLHRLFSATAVNIHPCVYDAYGMSIVEAAACGVPSMVHHVEQPGNDNGKPSTLSSSVGAAAELLRADQGEVVPMDVTDPSRCADVLAQIVAGGIDEASTSRARRISATATGYDGRAHGTAMLKQITDALNAASPRGGSGTDGVP